MNRPQEEGSGSNQAINHFKILRQLNLSVRISYLLPTCQEKLMDSYQRNQFFLLKIEYEVLRDSRS